MRAEPRLREFQIQCTQPGIHSFARSLQTGRPNEATWRERLARPPIRQKISSRLVRFGGGRIAARPLLRRNRLDKEKGREKGIWRKPRLSTGVRYLRQGYAWNTALVMKAQEQIDLMFLVSMNINFYLKEPRSFLPAARYEHAGLHLHFVLPSCKKAPRSI